MNTTLWILQGVLAAAMAMAGAAIVHLRRGETPAAIPPVALGVIAVIIAIGRFADL